MCDISLDLKIFAEANILSLKIGTNCPQGRNSGHEGKTVFILKNIEGTNISVSVDGSDLKKVEEIKIVLGGDTECSTFMRALSYASDQLNYQYSMNENNKF